MSDLIRARDALLGVQWAYDEARRKRVRIIRRLARVEVAGDAKPALDALVEALLRREAADADEASPVAQRLERVLVEARAARRAREQLGAEQKVQKLLSDLDRTWSDALAEAERLVVQLRERASPRISGAFDEYLVALRALHAVAPEYRDADVRAAQERAEAAVARLEAVLQP